MPNEHNSSEPPTDPKSQPLSQSPVAPPTPQQSVMSDPRNHDPEDEGDAAKELAREFGIVEKFQIGTNLLLAAVGIVALVIYNGQLKEMRKATKATQTAAEAAKSSADTADKTLKEIRSGGTDTHDLAIAAKNQATAAKLQVEEMKKQATDTHELASQAARQAHAAQIQAESTKEALVQSDRAFRISQQPIMAIGRKDGLIAEFRQSTDPDWYGLLLYFQNTGHLPALNVCVETEIFGIKQGGDIRRYVQKEGIGQFSVGGSACPTVAGDSVFTFNVEPDIPRKKSRN